MTRAFLHLVRSQFTAASRVLRSAEGSAILEFAITVPLLVLFVVGIFDFGGAFNQKQKIEQAAQEGAIVAAAQPTTDIDTSSTNPESLQPVVAAVFNSLAGSGVLANANVAPCILPPRRPTQAGLTWTYHIRGCSNYPRSATIGCMASSQDWVWIVINRGWVKTGATQPLPVGTSVTVSYDYHWRFNSVIQLLVPGATYSPKTCVSEIATVHNQI